MASDLAPPGRYRHVVCGVYRVIYRIEPERIFILRIGDTRQDPHLLSIRESAERRR